MTVTQEGNTIIVSSNLDSLNSYTSTVSAQGSGKWVGLVIDTGEDDITKLKYNGYDLTQMDVAEAASVGQGAGKFILWIKAEVVAETPKTFTLSMEGKESVTMTVTVVDA